MLRDRLKPVRCSAHRYLCAAAIAVAHDLLKGTLGARRIHPDLLRSIALCARASLVQRSAFVRNLKAELSFATVKCNALVFQ